MFPVIITENNSPKHIKRYVIIVSPMVQVGNEPEIGNGRKMAGEMAGGHFPGKAQNGRKNGWANGRTGRKWPNFRYPAICPAIFSAVSGLPRKMAAGHFSAISDLGLVSHL